VNDYKVSAVNTILYLHGRLTPEIKKNWTARNSRIDVIPAGHQLVILAGRLSFSKTELLILSLNLKLSTYPIGETSRTTQRFYGSFFYATVSVRWPAAGQRHCRPYTTVIQRARSSVARAAGASKRRKTTTARLPLEPDRERMCRDMRPTVRGARQAQTASHH